MRARMEAAVEVQDEHYEDLGILINPFEESLGFSRANNTFITLRRQILLNFRFLS
jgi:hypothetical protein